MDDIDLPADVAKRQAVGSPSEEAADRRLTVIYIGRTSDARNGQTREGLEGRLIIYGKKDIQILALRQHGSGPGSGIGGDGVEHDGPLGERKRAEQGLRARVSDMAIGAVKAPSAIDEVRIESLEWTGNGAGQGHAGCVDLKT